MEPDKIVIGALWCFCASPAKPEGFYYYLLRLESGDLFPEECLAIYFVCHVISEKQKRGHTTCLDSDQPIP